MFVVVTIIGVVIAIDAVIDGVFVILGIDGVFVTLAIDDVFVILAIDGVFVILGIDGVFVILAIVVGIVFFTFVLVGLKTIDVLRNKSGF